MGAELCSSPNLSVLLWDLARPPEVLGSLAGALRRHTWPDPGPASLERLFLLLPGLVAVVGAGWAVCWSVLGATGCSVSQLHIHPGGEIQVVSLAFGRRSVEHTDIENKCLFQLAPLGIISENPEKNPNSCFL